MMLVEYLPNEVFLEIFEYFNTHDLIRSFTQLNIRFHRLLRSHFQLHGLNLESLSKNEYDYICRHFLRHFIHQIPSLYLSTDETPGLLDSFLSQGFTLDQFHRLESLTLCNIHSFDTLKQLICQCRSLQFLSHLKISNNCQDETNTKMSSDLLDSIWNLKKLISCQLNGIQNLMFNNLFVLSSVSLSIQYLSMDKTPSNLINLADIFKHTPSLRRFHGLVRSYSYTDEFVSDLSSIKSLKLSFEGIFESLEKFLKTCSNLTYLDIDISRSYFDGNQWKSLIMNYLSNLKTFHLQMTFNLIFYNQNIEQILDSFRTDFWIKEHQWFVQCLWNPSDGNRLVVLYTSTQRNNLSHLFIDLPRYDTSQLNIFMLKSLKYLDVSICTHSNYSKLQILFNAMSNLYSLKIIFAMDLLDHMFSLTSSSIRRLNLLEQMIYFTKFDCQRLINCPLGQQCQVLLIRLNHRNSILDLIEQMNHLRSLVIECENDNANDLIQWLKRNLSLNDCIIQDSKND